jgi:glycosyltransferase involved in cell wall biosynthesis
MKLGEVMPVLSVIIPSHGRPHYLSRAIRSALLAAPPGGCEVVVVPNGSGEAWETIADEFADDHRVKWHPIMEANVSMARNHGLAAAQGDYVRFLDDDDFLYPEACRRQLEAALAVGADVCSGAVEVVDDDGRRLQVKCQPETQDICVAACGPSRLVQVGAHMFRLELAQRVVWNIESALAEDVQWFVEVVTQKELKWLRTVEPVSAWVQHLGPRLSVGHDPGRDTLEYFSEILLQAGERLSGSDRLTGERRIALADGLWSLLQKGLRYNYSYWRNISRVADGYISGRRPPSFIHRFPIFNKIPPLWIETMIIPIRWAYGPVQEALNRLGINRV